MGKKVYIGIIILIIIVLCIGIVLLIFEKSKNRNDILIKQQTKSQENSTDFSTVTDVYVNKITLDIDEKSVSNEGVILIITDNNEENLPWTDGYRIQKNINDNWVDLEPKNELITQAISHWKDENNQYKQQINWTYYYGRLENGQYRIIKPKYNPETNNYIDLYSEDFTISQ